MNLLLGIPPEFLQLANFHLSSGCGRGEPVVALVSGPSETSKNCGFVVSAKALRADTQA